MRFDKILILFIACLTAFCFCETVNSTIEYLQFKEGSQARLLWHRQTQIKDLLSYRFWDDGAKEFETFILDITLLSSNPETQSYPFEVKVIIRNFHFIPMDETVYANYGYSVSKDANDHCKKLINLLVDLPFFFCIKNEQEIEETAGNLEGILEVITDDKEVVADKMALLQDLLLNLFHLPNVNLEEEVLRDNSNFIDLKFSCKPSIDREKMKGKIHATWQGSLNFSEEQEFEGHTKIKRDVTWCADNALIQSGAMECECRYFMESDKVSIREKWSSIPLKTTVNN